MATLTICPPPFLTVFDNSGNIVSGGKVQTYLAGTTTPATTYSDEPGTTPNTNPIVADSAGRFTAFLTPGQSYKFVYMDASSNILRTADNISAMPASTAGVDITGTAGEALSAGNVVYLSDGSGSKTAGSWYKADNANAYSSTNNEVGMVTAAIASGASGTIRTAGSVSGLTSLTIGLTYYIGTGGAITSTKPTTNIRILGVADTTTSLVLISRPTLPVPTKSVVTITATGSQNDYAPGLVGDTTVRCNNATDLTITGFTAGYDGQTVRFVSLGAGNVYFAHQNTGSVAANRMINFATSANTGIAAGVGAATFQYDGATARWRLQAHEQGDVINYGSTSTVGGFSATSVKIIDYFLRGRLLEVLFEINGTSNATTFTFTLPFTSAAAPNIDFSLGYTYDNGGAIAVNGYGEVAGGASTVTLNKVPGTPSGWTNLNGKIGRGQFTLTVA